VGGDGGELAPVLGQLLQSYSSSSLSRARGKEPAELVIHVVFQRLIEFRC
jgi:hypothetical protein